MKKRFYLGEAPPILTHPLSQMCGFSLFDNRRFYMRGQYYRLNETGLKIVRFLATLASDGDRGDQPTGWLLKYRDEFRRIQSIKHIVVLSYLCQNTPHQGLLRLTIWLRGRCHGTLGTADIALHRNSPSSKVRKEVARALQRLHGWEWLRDIEAGDSSLQVRRLATQRVPKTFDNRLQRFLKTRAVVPSTDTPMEFFVDESVDFEGKRPKPSELIRAILERIRRLFRGEVESWQ